MLCRRSVCSGSTGSAAGTPASLPTHTPTPPDSLYLPDSSDGMALLSPCLDAVFPRFAYCGPQKVTRAQGEQVEALCPDREFCRAVRQWL